MRVENWPEVLADAMEKAEKREIGYGVFDCCLFPAEIVLAITGVDYAKDLRGYTSKVEAYRIIERFGSMETMITTLLNREPVHPAFAHRGDVVMGEFDEGPTAGICLGVHCAFLTPIGFRYLPRSAVKLAWKIE